MEKILPSSNLYSHPNKLLEDHLIGVSKLAKLFIAEKPLNIKEELSDLIQIIALTHDIGKATSYFQEYINADEKEKVRLKNQKKTKHSLFSSVCAYYLAKEIKHPNNFYPIFAFLTIKRHHGNLRDVLDDAIFDNDDAKTLYKQLESIDKEKLAILSDKLLKAGLPLLLNKQILSQCFKNFVCESKHFKRGLREINNDVSNYIVLNLLYSMLLDADKSDVVINDITIFERKELKCSDWVDNYKAKSTFSASPINKLRERAYSDVMKNSININNKIYSLNLPTGLGKTLIALSFALKLKEDIKSKRGANSRIIYALPFLSIIEQNTDVIESVIKINGVKPYTDVLLKHHHLSEIFYKKEDNEFEPNGAKILIEGWNAEIIVTTFIQLFHTLISNNNRSIRKFHRLSNSIIILDEVQSIPIKYWLLLREVLIKLSEMLNMYIILVTATEPLIFNKEEIKSLIDKNYYFKSMDRISLIHLYKQNETITINELYENFKLNDGKTYLFIFNTITATKDFYNLISANGVILTFLSTHIIPKERLKRIKEIKKGKYKVVVSTQLVEAGVDIDFDVVVRDIAPLDSINQAAGRCNRNGNNRGKVYTVILKDNNGRKYASYIYDSVLLDITQKILPNRNEIREGDFSDLIENYYIETKSKKTQDVSRMLLEAITRLRYDSEDDKTSISDFKLIEKDYIKRDVFIELDEDAEIIWNQYKRLKDIDNLFERKKAFDSLKADFYQYVISIPANIENTPLQFGELGYVKQSILEEYYDRKTGFITKDARSVVVW